MDKRNRYEKLIKRNTIHGHAPRKRESSTYMVWKGIKARCLNKNYKEYHLYGGRGIKIADCWMDFLKFLADMGERPQGMCIDRINNNGNYEPGNCRWATPKEQGNNRATNRIISFNGVSQSISMWSEKIGIREDTLRRRLDKGWNIQKALYHPVRQIASAINKRSIEKSLTQEVRSHAKH